MEEKLNAFGLPCKIHIWMSSTSIYSLMYHICIYVNRLMNEEDVIRPMVRNHKYASLFKDPKHDSE